MNSSNENYMQTALKLARRGIGSVEPNPAVGCIIVKGNQIIGKGWHKRFGGPHAEINALEDCKMLSISPTGATMYVTLEPCCHQGKTPPCTQAIIDAKIKRVYVATVDPSEHAGCKGIEELRNAGIHVETGLCQLEARMLNAPFIKFAKTGRPWVILKWAQTIDGKVAWADGGKQRWISSGASRKDVQKLRRRASAILVGINTVIADDPLLTARPAGKRPLTRIVLDSNLRIPLDCKLLKTAKKTPVLILVRRQVLEAEPQKSELLAQKGAELLAYPDMQGRSNLHFLLEELSKRRFPQLLIEGGPTVIASFLKERLADELIVYIAPKILGSKASASIAQTLGQVTEALSLSSIDIKRFDDDVRITGISEWALHEILTIGS
jgi:diaminohydroxyphosphoribosylaminopyrimidine deaminase/5-amino-6-(5-phosphoribosylamino)uracil reductase